MLSGSEGGSSDASFSVSSTCSKTSGVTLSDSFSVSSVTEVSILKPLVGLDRRVTETLLILLAKLSSKSSWTAVSSRIDFLADSSNLLWDIILCDILLFFLEINMGDPISGSSKTLANAGLTLETLFSVTVVSFASISLSPSSPSLADMMGESTTSV